MTNHGICDLAREALQFYALGEYDHATQESDVQGDTLALFIVREIAEADRTTAARRLRAASGQLASVADRLAPPAPVQVAPVGDHASPWPNMHALLDLSWATPCADLARLRPDDLRLILDALLILAPDQDDGHARRLAMLEKFGAALALYDAKAEAMKVPRWRRFFPDFDHEPPAIVTGDPESWEDSSDADDVCPSFSCDVFTLWVDYLDPAKREREGGKVYLMTCEGEPYLETDSLEDVRAFVEDGKRHFD